MSNKAMDLTSRGPLARPARRRSSPKRYAARGDLSITDESLAYLQKTLREMHEDARAGGDRLDIPPSELFVWQTVPSDHRTFNTGQPLSKWLITRESIQPCPLEEQLPDEAMTGMYYNRGRANFSVLESQSVLRVGWQLGPRLGRGFDIPIQDGHIAGEPRLTWVS
jgi:hypothetical protein